MLKFFHLPSTHWTAECFIVPTILIPLSSHNQFHYLHTHTIAWIHKSFTKTVGCETSHTQMYTIFSVKYYYHFQSSTLLYPYIYKNHLQSKSVYLSLFLGLLWILPYHSWRLSKLSGELLKIFMRAQHIFLKTISPVLVCKDGAYDL